MYEDPIAFFVTWTVYGTHLQGDELGWRQRGHGFQPPQRLLDDWHKTRLVHSIQPLHTVHRQAAEAEIARHCAHREWHLWACNARSTHVHVVVTAQGYSGDVVRDQLKANATRGVRSVDNQFKDRPVWTRGGDWQCINDENELECVLEYVQYAQDRKHLER